MFFFVACLLATAMSQSMAQSGNVAKDPANFSSEIDNNVVYGKQTTTAKKITNVHAKTLYAFEKLFKNVNDVNWYALDEKERTYLVYFNTDNHPSMALFQKKGGLLYAITYYAEADLPPENRKIIKSNYVDYMITYVKKVMSGGKTAWIANLVSENKLVIVKTIEGQLEEMESYELSKN